MGRFRFFASIFSMAVVAGCGVQNYPQAGPYMGQQVPPGGQHQPYGVVPGQQIPQGGQQPYVAGQPGMVVSGGGAGGITGSPQTIPLRSASFSDPNLTLLPPQGTTAQWEHYPTYFQGLQTPYSTQPIFKAKDARAYADYCYRHKVDLRQFNEVFRYFSSIETKQDKTYRRLWNGHTAVRVTTAIITRQGGFDLKTFQRHYQYYSNCMGPHGRMYTTQEAIQRSFSAMNIRINVQEYVI